MNRYYTFSSLAVIFVGMTTSLFAQVDSAVIEAQNRRIAIVENVTPSVVAIFSAGGNGGGSGVLISPDGYALTNFHVTQGAGTFMKCGLSDGHLYDAVVVGIDPTGDVALVKMLGRDDFPYSPMGDSDQLQIGDWSFAMGNPFLLATDFKPTVTYGIISGMHRYQYPAGRNFLEYTDCIQIDTSINPGNSGGPLFNDAGELVGINGRGSFEKRGRVNSGAGYAISINQIKNFMDHLKSGRIVDHATLGASVSTRDDGAVVVQSILEESEAARRGLELGDEIISFAGRPIRSVNQYKNILGIYPKGWIIPLVYRRGGEKKEIHVRLRALHRASDFNPTKKKKKSKKKRPGFPRPKKKAPKSKPPAKYKHMYVKKSGFANFYFNNQQKKRVLDKLSIFGDFSKASGAWKLMGKTDKGTAFSVTLNDAQSQLSVGGKKYLQKISGNGPDPEFAFEERYPGSGGFVLAMHNLRLFLNGSGNAGKGSKKAGKFTSFIYLGSEPMDGRLENPVDVLVSGFISEKIGDKVDCRWFFDKTDGTFLGFDTSLGTDKDECQIRFDEFQNINGRKFPKTMTVRHANKNIATFQIESVEFASGS